MFSSKALLVTFMLVSVVCPDFAKAGDPPQDSLDQPKSISVKATGNVDQPEFIPSGARDNAPTSGAQGEVKINLSSGLSGERNAYLNIRGGYIGTPVGGVEVGVEGHGYDHAQLIASTGLYCSVHSCLGGTLVGGRFPLGQHTALSVQGRMPYFAMVIDRENNQDSVLLGGARVGLEQQLGEHTKVLAYLDANLTNGTDHDPKVISRDQNGLGALVMGGGEFQHKFNGNVAFVVDVSVEDQRYQMIKTDSSLVTTTKAIDQPSVNVGAGLQVAY